MARGTLSVATHLAPSVLPLYAFIADYLGERLGCKARLTVSDSYQRCAADIDDVCFVCSVPYLLFSREGRIRMEVLAAPVLAGSRYAGRPVYFSDVVVARDSSFGRFVELKGCRWAFNEPFSHSGYIVVWHHLLERGYGADFFGEMIESGFHQVSLRLVAERVVDAAAVDSQVLAIALRDDPQLADRVRIIGVMGPSTIQPVVASISRLSTAERQVIREAILSLADEPAARPILAAAGVDRFVAVADPDYADVRTMLARVEAADMLPSDWMARWSHETGGGTDGSAYSAVS